MNLLTFTSDARLDTFADLSSMKKKREVESFIKKKEEEEMKEVK
jgi:hypothetical protein